MKQCEECKILKSLSEFYRLSRNNDGKENKCKACRKIKNNLWYQNNKEKHIQSNKPASIKRRFGITLEEYEKITANPCEICGTTDDLSLDHCHVTGIVRGCLCRKCNAALGLFKDNKKYLEKAIKYLARNE